MSARALLALAQGAALAVVSARLARGRVRSPALAKAQSAAAAGAAATTDRAAPSTVSVLIPARDEAERIAPCLRGLADDGDLVEILVIDDGSTDATADLARSFGARVLAGAEPPPGWIGKPWALQQGLEAASSEVVVCLDADARPQPGLARALAQLIDFDTADLITAGPRFACDSPGERLLHPSMLASLVLRYGPGDSDPPPPAGRILANGQCTAAPRAKLLAAGGYAAAAGHMADDAALARSLAAAGWRVAFRDAGGLLEVKMHDSAREAWREWGRSIALADVEPVWRRLTDTATIWLVMGLPWVRLATRRATPLDRAALGFRTLLLLALRDTYTTRGPAYWASPLADLATAARLTWSNLRPSRSWRGRTYVSATRRREIVRRPGS